MTMAMSLYEVVLDMRRELLKGNTQTLIMAVLRDGPQHGYAIAREIVRRSDKALRFGEGTLYPGLRALEDAGFVAGEWETTAAAPARKVYRLTDEGLRELQRRTSEWREFSTAVDQILGGNADGQPA
jgi:DNA-binding PadR family transcriptional regulator